MKKISALIFASIFVFAAISCSQDEEEYIPPGKIDVDLKSTQIISADNQFGLELFKQINGEEDPEKNMMISPLSVSLALAMVYNGADGDTRDQMEEMLHKVGLSPEEINQSYKFLVDALVSHDSKVELSISNAIFYDENFSVKPDFIATNQTNYYAEVDQLNFRDSQSTTNTINDWVKDKTHDKIKKIIDSVSPSAVMYLLNAIYFNAEWTHRFDKDNTQDQVFFLEDGSEINVPTMTVEDNFNYLDTETFELLEMPYGGEKYSMLIFVPHPYFGVTDIIDQLSAENIETWLKNMNGWNKKVFLPKFEFAYKNSLTDNLQVLGMLDAFDSELSNFAGISDQSDLYISKVMHKTYIKVDEKGTEAAAVTSVGFDTTSAGPTPFFAADHPFVFAIREKDTNAILFTGKVMNPLLKE